jgi:hypothetical protein
MKSANYAAKAPTMNHYQVVEDILAPEDVHEANTISEATATNGLFIILALIFTVLHGINLYLLLETGVWTIIPILFHLVLSAVLIVITYGQYKKGLDVQHLGLMTIVSTATGIFGTLGALFGFFTTAIFRSRAQHFTEWYESIFPTDHLFEPEVINDQIIEGIDENPSRYSVMPFTDVMRLGSENQKRRALGKMTTRFSPRFAPAFKIGLSDKSNSIRVQAATSVAKIERDFAAKLNKIEAARVKEPRNALITMALAKFYDDYAFIGVLDPELEALNRERAIGTYKSYLQQDPNSAEAWTAVGRLMFRNQQWEEAADWFRSALDRGWRSESMLMWYFECLFRLGQYRELRRALLEYGRSIVHKEEMPADVRNAVSMWMQVA